MDDARWSGKNQISHFSADYRVVVAMDPSSQGIGKPGDGNYPRRYARKNIKK